MPLGAGCKINLGLRITGRLANGYHTLRSIFYPLPWPRDELEFIRIGDTLEFSPRWEKPESNTVFRAWRLFGQDTGFQPGVRVRLIKRVPIGSGLGGGSANAAAIIRWLNDRSGQILGERELINLAMRVGADVPFFLRNCPCLVEGIGEKMTPVALDTRGLWLVLVYPGFVSNTAVAFAAFDAAQASPVGTERDGLTESHLCAIGSDSSVCAADSASIWEYLRNDLEGVVFAMFPALAELKGEILRLGAEQAAMSGSGSSVYGVFASAELAVCAAQTLRQNWPRVYSMPLLYSGM